MIEKPKSFNEVLAAIKKVTSKLTSIKRSLIARMVKMI